MFTNKFPDLFSQFNIKIVRLVLGIVILISLVALSAIYSFAGFSGISANKNNKIVAANFSMKLMTTNKPINILPNSAGQSVPAPLPTTITDFYSNGNTLISIDDEDKTNRKFFEYNKNSEITNIQPGFRQQRPLIIQNDSNAGIDYTIEFLTREIEKPGLPDVFFFHYTKVGEDIPIESLNPNDATPLIVGESVKNTGKMIQKIGKDKSIHIKPKSCHIYVVDMGIQSTAGNTIQGAGMLLDIVLSSAYVENTQSTTTSVISSIPVSSILNSSTSTSSVIESSTTTSTPSNLDPFANYVDYNAIVDSGSYGGGKGTAAEPYLINTTEEFKHFIENTTSKRTYVKVCTTISKIKNMPSTIVNKEAIIFIEGDNRFSCLDISATQPSTNPLNPLQRCTYYYQGIPSNNYSWFFEKISYRGNFVE